MGEKALAASDMVTPASLRPADADAEIAGPLSSGTPEGNRLLHGRLFSYFQQELQRQAANRYQMAKDEDYYDSLQHTDEEIQAMLRRGQMPVAWNEAKPTIDWLIGTERRTRTDFEIIARNDDSEEASDDARVKTKLLKYLNDVNRTEFERSHAFSTSIKGGLAYVEVGLNADPEKEPVFQRAESWRYCLYDSMGSRLDFDDSRYFFRFKQIDVDVAKAFFPGKEPLIDAAATALTADSYLKYYNGQPITDMLDTSSVLPERWKFYDGAAWLNNVRQRVTIIEAWHREPVRVNGRIVMQMRLTLMTEFDVLLTGASPYKHNRFPFIPLWCYRRSRDNAPYGVMRALRGPQDAVNKAMSKAVWEASANQMIMEEDAIDPKVMDADELRTEMAAPDGMGVLAPGGLAKFKTIDRTGKVNGQMQIAERGLLNIRNAGGVTGENLGQTTAAQSGKAITAKQDQGSVATAEIFDNLLLAHQMEGELVLSLIEQFYTEQKVFSITGDRGRREFERVNVPQDDGTVLNDITQRSAQFVIGQQAWRQTLMQAQFEAMMQLLGQMATISPQVVNAMLADVIELGDFPNKKAFVSNVRKALNQPDPDEKMTPEQMQEAQKAQQRAEKQAQQQIEKLDADIKVAIAKGEQMDASALEARVRAMYESLQAAQVVATIPNVAPVADVIMQGAGFVDQQGTDPNIPAPGMTIGQALPPTQMQSPAPAAVPSAQPQIRPTAAEGAGRGIETVRPDGVDRGLDLAS